MSKYLVRTLQIFILFQFLTLSGYSQLLTTKNNYSRYDSLLGSLNPMRSYDALHYDLDLAIDPETKSIGGQSTMRFLCTKDMVKLQIDLFAQYQIDRISMNGMPLNYERDSNFIFITFPKPLTKGKEYSITVSYSGTPIAAIKAPWDGGFDWKLDANGKHWIGVACEGMGASSWWPCKDHWSDEPQEGVVMHVIVPAPYQAIANGRLVHSISKNGKNEFTWQVKNPINLYNISVNIGDYIHWDTAYWSPIKNQHLDMQFWVLRTNEKKARKQFSQVYPMMECYESKLGPYPFYEDGYKLVETPYLGMEHQSCVAYGNKYLNGYLGDMSMTGGYDFDYIIIHETGHEWFGNNITAADNADMWIHEAFTTYTESLYAECMYGSTAGSAYLKKMRRRVRNTSPIVGQYGVAKEGSGDMYAKGALFLHTLRQQINHDSLWYALIRGINPTFILQTVHYNDILQYFNQRTGKKWDVLFDTYLKETKIPELFIIKDKKGKANISLHTPHNQTLTMKFKFTIDGKKEWIEISNKKAKSIRFVHDIEPEMENYVLYSTKISE